MSGNEGERVLVSIIIVDSRSDKALDEVTSKLGVKDCA